MTCLDTSFVIDLIHHEDSAINLLKRLEESNEEIFLASPTIMELFSTTQLNVNPEKEIKKLKELISTATILPLDEESAILAGEIEGQLILAGETIPPLDIMIGAIAKHNGETLITRNNKHFGRITKLKIETY
jgi:tRNA(fMet)-specific endonuclease VapC